MSRSEKKRVVEKNKEKERCMARITMKMLLEAGVHFGHQTNKWNPKMKPYIFGARNGIYIVDLQQTVGMFEVAYNYIADVVASGRDVLFVGTKKQAQESIKAEAERCSMPYVNHRWLGGMLTNFDTIKKSIDKLNHLDSLFNDERINAFPKKEILGLQKERDKLEKVLGGIRHMTDLPGAVFVVDPKKELIAVKEANKLDIPIAAIVDTNCDPDDINFIIPGNDDAIRAIKLFASKIADAVMEGKARFEELIQAQTDKERTEEQTVDNGDADVPESVESKEDGADVAGLSEDEMMSEEEE
jgi:small subunit ribosomal protein S2